MKKITTLPKKQFAMESAVDATDNPSAEDSGENQDLLAATFPINTTNFRRDFIEQAKQLKEKLVLGKTPERIEHPKNTYTLDSKGNLKGDMELVKETGTTATIDLTKRAEAVNEGVKKPVFTRKSSVTETCSDKAENSDSTVNAEDSTVPVKDERESEDKQPKEAVACESRFPKFNRREQALVSAGDANAVRAQMKSGALSKTRGRQILYTMGATEEAEEAQEVFTTAPADAGQVIENTAEDFTPSATCCCKYHGEPLMGIIDTEIGDEFDCDVAYTSKDPIEGQIVVKDKEVADKISGVFESLGVKSKILSAKEEYAVLFTEEKDVPVAKWFALIKDKANPNKVSQVTLTVQEGANEEQIREYLLKTYSPEQIMSISDVKYS